MTLAEFLAPLKKGTHQDRVLAVLYFKERYEQKAALTADEIGKALKAARAPGSAKVNVHDVLAKAAHFVDAPGVAGQRRLWTLTESGRQQVRSLLGLPSTEVELEHDAGTLTALVATLADEDTKSYLNEALKCLRVSALRAAVVFVWTAAMHAIRTQMIAKPIADVNAAITKHDPKARAVSRLDDFAYIKDSIALLAAKDLGIFDKNEKDALDEALNLRNRCGHPSKYRPGVKKVSSFIEDVTTIVLS